MIRPIWKHNSCGTFLFFDYFWIKKKTGLKFTPFASHVRTFENFYDWSDVCLSLKVSCNSITHKLEWEMVLLSFPLL